MADSYEIPRWVWYTTDEATPEDAELWKAQFSDISASVHRTMLLLLGYAFICLLTLGQPAGQMLATGAITLPIVNTTIGFVPFLIVGPFLLIVITVYLHIFVGRWNVLRLSRPSDELAPQQIFNLRNRFAAFTSWSIFYLLPILVAILFTWKSLPAPGELQSVQLIIMYIGTISLLFLALRRSRGSARIAIGVLLLASMFTAWIVGKQDRGLNLERADLQNADLSGFYLSFSNLRRANLSGADLYGARLYDSNIDDAKMVGADLRDANLSDSDLTSTDLTKADLTGANLYRAYLKKAVLVEADLTGAVLDGAYFGGADLTGATVEQSQLNKACGDAFTTWPDGRDEVSCRDRWIVHPVVVPSSTPFIKIGDVSFQVDTPENWDMVVVTYSGDGERQKHIVKALVGSKPTIVEITIDGNEYDVRMVKATYLNIPGSYSHGNTDGLEICWGSAKECVRQ